MPTVIAFLAGALILLVGSCAQPPPPPPIVILVGVDGLRWDYLETYAVHAPTLRTIAAEGVRASRLIPVFPTNTFPNFYSMATGLRPERHGIVNSSMYDPALDASFAINDAAAVADSRWWGGEPLWVSAERQGVKAATMFWVGSEAEIAGFRPSLWMPYNARMPNFARVDTVLAWLDHPVPPSLVLLYFSDVDRAGHDYGPDSEAVGRALGAVDSSIARLLDGLTERSMGSRVDLLVVSDHGMASVRQSPSRSIFLGDLADMSQVRAGSGASVGLYSAASDSATASNQLAALEAALTDRHPALRIHRKAELVDEFSPAAERRWPPLMAVAEEGWTIRPGRSARFYPPDTTAVRGGHGYLQDVASMHGIFVARGPSFGTGVVLDRLHVEDVYGIVCRTLGVEAAPNDGSMEAFPLILYR